MALYSSGRELETVSSFCNDSWQMLCIPVVGFLFTTSESRDNLAQDSVSVSGE